MADLTLIQNCRYDGTKPYYVMMNGQRYNRAYYNKIMLFGSLDKRNEPFYVANPTQQVKTVTIQQHIYSSTYSGNPITIQWSRDRQNWYTLDTTSTNTPLTLTLYSEDKIYLRCDCDSWFAGGCYNTIIGMPKVGGNIMSLLYGSRFTGYETSYKSYNNESAFRRLFYLNTELTDASELILPELQYENDHCYQEMFGYCANLVNPPKVVNGIIGDGSCTRMFIGCSSMTTAPELPSTTLGIQCYLEMFYDCTSLTEAPALPATTLAYECYLGMFYRCTSLTAAPVLPAIDLNEPEGGYWTYRCYANMFQYCTNLHYIKAMFLNDIVADNTYLYTQYWVTGVPQTGTFVKNINATWPNTLGQSYIPEYWIPVYAFPEPVPETAEFLKFTSTSSTAAVGIENVNNYTLKTGQRFFYSYDKEYWHEYTPDGTLITIPQNGCVYWYGTKGLGYEYFNAGNRETYLHFIGNDQPIYCFGNIMSLCGENWWSKTTVEWGQFESGFRDFTTLISAPQLPATNVGEAGYGMMFMNCTSLTESPVIPDGTYVDGAMMKMFYGCSSLSTITCFVTDLTVYGLTDDWTYNVAATGTFYKATGVTWPTGTSGIPTGWTVVEV